jgi:hypothetical protein
MQPPSRGPSFSTRRSATVAPLSPLGFRLLLMLRLGFRFGLRLAVLQLN